MSSPEYNRRHYGIVADEKPLQRISQPPNLDRRLAQQVGINTPSSPPLSLDVDPPKSPHLITLIPIQVPVAAIDTWRVGAASGTRITRPQDIMVVPKRTNNVPLVVDSK